jgi:hypothetical protein
MILLTRTAAVLLVLTHVWSSSGIGIPIKKERAGMKLPIVLPQVQIEPNPKEGFVFGFNNCDGGYWETVVFPIQSGEIVLVTFSTPTIAGAGSSQSALGALRGTDRLIEGWKGKLTLKTSSADKNRSALKGTLSKRSGEFAEDASGNCQNHEDTQAINLKNIPRFASSDYDLVLSALQSLPGLKNAKLSKMCQ